jgi:S1-C subfamily serine protease
MRYGRHALALVAIVAAVPFALGAAEEEGKSRASGRAQVIVIDENGDRHERVWSFGDDDRGWLGVMLHGSEDGDATIADVVDDSPASRAGLKEGDVIVGIDGDAVRTPRDVVERLGEREPGDEVEIEVSRDGRRETVKVELGERPQAFAFGFGGEPMEFDFDFDPEDLEEHMRELHEHLKGMQLDKDAMEELHRKMKDGLEGMDFDFGPGFAFRSGGGPRLGIHVVEPTPELREFVGGSGDAGVLVGKVLPGTPAEKAGLQVGDLLVAVDGEKVGSAGDVRRVLSERGGETVALDVIRDGKPMTLQAALPEPEEGDEILSPPQPSRRPAAPPAGLQKT